MAESNVVSSVNEELFYQKLCDLKASTKGRNSKVTVFINDDFYDAAKAWLKSGDNDTTLKKPDIDTIERKKWAIENGKIISKDGKYVFQSEIFSTHLQQRIQQ